MEVIMEVWYRTGGYGKNLIEPVNVVKSTDKTLWIRESDYRGRESDFRVSIISNLHRHFPAWEEAKAFLLAKSESRIESLRTSLEREKGYLGNIRGLKNPDQQGAK